MHTLKKFSILVIFLALVKIANSQPVTVNFIHKNEKISTVMTGLSDSHLFTVSDSINLDEILSLYFSETLPDSSALIKLHNLDIYVYLKEKRYKVKVKDQREFNSPVSIGLGFGIDYGGFGMKVSLFPAKPIGVFAGIGHNTLEAAFNLGIDWKFKYMKRTSGFLACMYGYNTITDIDEDEYEDHNTYYGLSAQLGARMRVGKQKNYLSLGIIVPITRDSKIKELKKLYGDDLDYSPILLSLGFHFGL